MEDPSESSNDGGETIGIVVAEDHALVRAGLRLLVLRHPRLRWIGEAADGETALALVREHRPQLLVLDLGLPRLDGMAVMQMLARDALPTRVLVVTARQDPASVRAALALGAQGYLLKTDDADALLDALLTVAGGGWHVSPELAGVFESAPRDGAAEQPLTAREQDIATRVGRGHSSKRIGLDLGISEHTVRKHRENIARKLGLRNAAELVAWTIRHRLV
jgi:DNA-binding NarL/FixJ family response regulator